jgi:hypothetical protein
MAEETSIREKTTEPILFQVLSNGNIVDLTGVNHIEMHMIDAKGKVYRYASNATGTPAVTIASAVLGKVTFTPPDETVFKYTRTPYKLYIEVFDTATEHYTVPEAGEENIINVRKEF